MGEASKDGKNRVVVEAGKVKALEERKGTQGNSLGRDTVVEQTKPGGSRTDVLGERS